MWDFPDFLDPNAHTEILSLIFGTSETYITQIQAVYQDACVCSVETEAFGDELLVRVIRNPGRFHVRRILQDLVQTVVPDLVPKAVKHGSFTAPDGEEFEYAVEYFVHDTHQLFWIWDSLRPEEQRLMVDSITDALTKVQGLKLNDSKVRRFLKNTPFSEFPIGSPELAYCQDIPSLLDVFKTQYAPESAAQATSILRTPDGITIKSMYNGIPSLNLSAAELKFSEADVILCHLDLETRNILVRPTASDARKYELASIVDWEIIGWFPLAYKFALKHLLFGLDSMDFTYYELVVERMSGMLPDHRATDKLIAAFGVIWESNSRFERRTFENLDRKLWIAKQGLVWGGGRKGWVRKELLGAAKWGPCLSKDRSGVRYDS